MKDSVTTLLALLSVVGLVAAQDIKPVSTPTIPGASGSAPTPANAIATTTGENLILKGAELKTEWANARNPFRFEANETPAYAPERVEQMQVLGFSKMPDENGIVQTYAFVTKTTEGSRVQAGKPETKVTKEVYVLRALPEKLDEETVTTEEQIDECSISLGGEQLWFLGVIQTNSQTLAIFIPDNATYPIKEEELRPFEIQDSLKDLHMRVTKAGQKISTEANASRALSRPKNQSTPTRSDTPTPPPSAKPIETPSSSQPAQIPAIHSTPAGAENAAPPRDMSNPPENQTGNKS